MDCSTVSKLMMEYLDGQIDKEDEILLMKHIEGCADCSFEFQALRETFSIIDQIEMEEPSVSFEEKVMKRVREENAALKRSRTILFITLSLVAVIAGWFGIIYAMSGNETGSVFSIINQAASVFYSIFTFVYRIWYSIIEVLVKILAVGRAMSVVREAVLETYDTLIIAAVALVFAMLKLYDYAYKTEWR